MKLSDKKIERFRGVLLNHYDRHARNELPWRQPETNGTFDAYKIWVSELMLQQTQVGRVVPKYQAFLQQFPTVRSLAAAQLAEVLIAWQGLGYNRRAKYLWQAAQQVVEEHAGRVPNTAADLVKLPGIGTNTAGAILAYAYNQPALFIETNIRSVYLHHFFGDKAGVTDKELLALLTQTIDTQNPREFYWALMDYGSQLKKQGHGAIQRSKHYTKQSAFEGSVRQVRGHVLRLLSTGPMTTKQLLETLVDDRAPKVLEQLEQEQLIRKTNGGYCLA